MTEITVSAATTSKSAAVRWLGCFGNRYQPAACSAKGRLPKRPNFNAANFATEEDVDAALSLVRRKTTLKLKDKNQKHDSN